LKVKRQFLFSKWNITLLPLSFRIRWSKLKVPARDRAAVISDDVTKAWVAELALVRAELLKFWVLSSCPYGHCSNHERVSKQMIHQ
jgi:hypothetical protein